MLRKALVGFISAYQRYLRGFLPCACRFYPTCSDYAKEALTRLGIFQGSLKAFKRLLRCHPWSGKSGYDPLV